MPPERPLHISPSDGPEVPRRVEGTEGTGAEARETAEVAEGVKKGIIASLGNKLWERVPSFDSKAARERIQNLKPADVMKALSAKEFWGRVAGKVFVGSSGAVAGRITRYGLGAVTGGAGYAIAMGGGAVGGAVVKGLEVYIRERKREVSRDEFVEKAFQYREKDEKVDRDLDASVKAEEDERGQIITVRQRTERERKIGEMRSCLDRYLELTKTETPEGSSDETDEQKKEKDDLYRELKREVGVRWGEVLRGARNGAIVGAIGGAAGEGLMHLLGLRETAQAASAATETAKNVARTAKDETVNQALCNKMSEAAREAGGKTYEKAIEQSLQKLTDQDFIGLIGKGEVATHAARRMIHDYITQELALGKNYVPGKAQLVYTEDYLSKVLEKNRNLVIANGFRIKGVHIKLALSLAGVDQEGVKLLTDDQIANLNKNWVGKISKNIWDKILDYSGVSNSQNNFAGEMINVAKQQAEKAMNGEVARCAEAAANEANRQIQDAIGRGVVRTAAQNWLMGNLVVGAIALGTAGASLGTRFALNKKKPKEEEDGNAAFERKREGFKQEHERKQEEEKKLQRELAALGVPKEFRSRSIKEERAKLEFDPLMRILRSKGIRVEKGNIEYTVPNVEDMKKEQAISIRTITFTSYTDYRAYLERRTAEERRWVSRTCYADGSRKGKPMMNIWKKFGENIPEDVKVEVNNLEDKAREGLLADEFRGKREVETAKETR